MNCHIARILILFIADTCNQNDESLDDVYDSAYENLKEETKKQGKVSNDDVVENPYYETDFNLEQETTQKKNTEAVNLEETEVVIAKENIYYDIWITLKKKLDRINLLIISWF